MSELLDTGRFSFETAYDSAAWADAMAHPEEHENPEVLEYDISTFVYERRKPLDIDRLSEFVQTWPDNVIRSKGMLWIGQDPDMCYVFEQAGSRSASPRTVSSWIPPQKTRRSRSSMPTPSSLMTGTPHGRPRHAPVLHRSPHDKDAIVDGLDACITEWVRD